MTNHYVTLGSTPETVRFGRLPAASAEPVATLADGGVLVLDTVSHEGILPDQGSDPVAFFTSLGVPEHEVMDDAREIAAAGLPRDPDRDGPHVVTGPVAVASAAPGDLLRVEMLGFEHRATYGIVSNRHGRGVLGGELPEPGPDGEVPPVVSHLARVAGPGTGELADSTGRRIRFRLSEFLGLVGVTPDSGIEHPSTPPGRYGGNLDVRRLGIGSSLYLPVQVGGALFYAGDPHFAQGNGEVALTAFEAPLRATLRLSVERGPQARRIAEAIDHPYGETPSAWIAIGLGDTLDEAMRRAVRHALSMVVACTGLERSTALAYLSAAADFEVSQAVNGVRGVHCVIRKRDLVADPR